MRDMNIWHGTGRIGRDPEVKTTQSGKEVCSLGMACQFDDHTTWIDLVFWDKLASIVGSYLTKGSQIRVSGRLQVREWEQDGVKNRKTEVVVHEMQMLGSKEARAERPGDYNSPPAYPDDDSDIPF